MKKIVFVPLVLMLLCTTLFSDNVKALGSSFSMLIPDSYEDAKQFPDRINLEKKSSIEVRANDGMEGTAFVGYSRIGERFKSRHELGLRFVEDYGKGNERIVNEDLYLDTNHIFGFKLGNVNLGFSAEFHGSLENRETNTSAEPIYYDERIVEKSFNSVGYAKGELSSSIRVSAGFGESKSFSIGLKYKQIEFGDDESIYQRDVTMDGSYILEEQDYNHDDEYSEEYKEYSLSMIKDFGSKLKSRIYANFSYRIYDEIYDVKSISDYGDSSIDNTENELYHDKGEISEGKAYSVELGYGNVREMGKLKLFSGVSFQLDYYELDTSEFEDFSSSSSSGDTETDYSNSYSFQRAVNEYYYCLKIPLGFSYQFNKYFMAAGSITLKAEYDGLRRIGGGVDTFRIGATTNLGFEFTPNKKWKLGVYNINNLSDVNKWNIGAKYNF